MTMRHTAAFGLTLISSLALAACAGTPVPTVVDRIPPVEVQVLAINDFHGNLEVPQAPYSYTQDGVQVSRQLGGAAQLGAALATLRGGHRNTVTVAAGDLIGASPFVSANFLDEPAVMALNLAGLDIASVGNHEFDRGTDELRRVADGGCTQYTSRTPCALDSFAGADFDYLAGNVIDDEGRSFLPGATMRDFGGIRIGFIGLTLRDTASLVSPSATLGYRFADEADTANALARELVAEGANTVVLLIHEGARPSPQQNLTGCPNISGPLLPILDRLDSSIGLVVSGHTHFSYICEFPMQDGGSRLLTSAGKYGAFITDIRLRFDPASEELAGFSALNVPVDGSAGTATEIDALVRRYLAGAAPIAARVVGDVSPAEGAGVNCIEETAEDLVADAQLAAGRKALPGTDMAFINTGGVRTDLSSAEDGVMTYGEIFAMQPFGNSLQIRALTGAQLYEVMEQQFCEGETGPQARTCFSLLVPSGNVSYAFDRSKPMGERITAMLIDGEPVDRAASYEVVLNNFIANGGDGFTLFASLPVVAEAGLDLDALEAWFADGAMVPVCGRLRDDTPIL